MKEAPLRICSLLPYVESSLKRPELLRTCAANCWCNACFPTFRGPHTLENWLPGCHKINIFEGLIVVRHCTLYNPCQEGYGKLKILAATAEGAHVNIIIISSIR